MTQSLVTGGAGFIGSHVADHCLRLGHEVVVVDDMSGGNAMNVPTRAAFICGSVTDAHFVDSVFASRKFDYVYHLAAYAAEGLSHHMRAYNYANNVVGSMNVVNACIRHDVSCLVFTSSIAVYGSIPPPMSERQTPKPEDPYGIAKYAVEMDLAAARKRFGLNYVVFRPHNVYGPHQNVADRYRNVVGIFMNQLMRGEKMTIFGDGCQVRAFTYIDDVAPYIARSAGIPELYGETFNVGAGDHHTVIELAHMVAEAMGKQPRVEFLPPRDEVRDAYAEDQKLRIAFEMRPPMPLREGLAEMARWALERGPLPAPPLTRIEVERGLPEVWKREFGKLPSGS